MFTGLLQKFTRQQAPNIIEKNSFSWTRLLVYVWATRLVFTAVSILVPGVSLLGWLAKAPVVNPIGKGIELISWENFMSKLQHVRFGQLPVQYINVPHLPAKNVDYLLSTGLHSIVKKAKRSPVGSFRYHDSNTLWSRQYRFPQGFEEIQYHGDFTLSSIYRSSEVIDQCIQGNFETTCENSYYYISERIDNPTANPFLTTLVPSMDALINGNVVLDRTLPSVMSWIASEGSVTAPHYDMEDNFFVQVSGTKTITISSPSAFRIFSTFPSMHPAWRQAQLSHLNATRLIKDDVQLWNEGQAWSVQSAAKSKEVGYELPKRISCRDQVGSNPDTGLPREGNKQCSLTDIESAPGLAVEVWEVTLYPGSILYIPAFYFHSTVAGPNSLSINMWTKSIANEIREKIALVPLPFQKQDSIGVKLASLGAAVRLVVFSLGVQLDWFLRDLNSRYVGLIASHEEEQSFLSNLSGDSPDDAWTENSYVLQLGKISCMKQFNNTQLGKDLCSSLHHAVGEANPTMRKTVALLSAYLTSDPIDSAIQQLLLMDYIEEVAEVILSPLEMPDLLTPCAMSNFVATCIARS